MKRGTASARSSPRVPCQYFSITPQRALVLDILYFARQIPLFPVEQTFDLAELAAQRAAAHPRIAWSVLFLKGYALVALEHRLLRRAFVRWPRPHFIEFPLNYGMVTVEREHLGQERLCWASFRRPEKRQLIDLDGYLRWYQQQPVEEAFGRQVLFSRLPTPLRRLIWWWNLNFAGFKRAHRLGTFSISSLAGQHTLNRGHPTLLTSSLTYGPLDENGRCVVTLLCDHRVIDGVPAARALADLERILRGEICDELATLARARAA